MKFTTVLVLLALALGANSSIIPGGHLVIGGPLGGSVVVGHAHAHAHAHAIAHAHDIAHVHAHDIAHVHAHGPAAITVAASPVHAHGPAAITVAASPVHHAHGHLIAGPGPVQIVSGPIHAHSHVVAAAPAVVPGATFVAKTRGAVHVAPLAGHVQSVVSANLQPAPGTH